ncbi:unnamed protein product, partial [Iphiclides podalirius]
MWSAERSNLLRMPIEAKTNSLKIPLRACKRFRCARITSRGPMRDRSYSSQSHFNSKLETIKSVSAPPAGARQFRSGGGAIGRVDSVVDCSLLIAYTFAVDKS